MPYGRAGGLSRRAGIAKLALRQSRLRFSRKGHRIQNLTRRAILWDAWITGKDAWDWVRKSDDPCTGCQAVNKLLDRRVIQPIQFPKPFIPQRLEKGQPVRQRT